MKFLYYTDEIFLPLLEGEYKIVANNDVFAYKYENDGELFLATKVKEKLFALFQLKNNLNNDECLDKIYQVLHFYRETIGTMPFPLPTEFTREVQTIYNLYGIRNILQNRTLISNDSLNFEITQIQVGEGDYWHLSLEGHNLFSLRNRRGIERALKIIKRDIIYYVEQRWKIR